jgi:O-antigen/teichoic acid export membrane protein
VALNRRLTKTVAEGPRRYAPGAWLRGSLPQFMVGGFYLLLTYCDVIVLERFVSSAEVGIYYAATKIVAFVAFVYFCVSAASAHKFAEYLVSGRRDELRSFVQASIRWTFLPSAIMAAAILVAGAPLMKLFGPGFSTGTSLLPILLAGLLARASIGPAERLLTMGGQQRACALVYALAFGVNLSLCFALVPGYGPSGAAAATSTAMLLESILLFILAKRRLGLNVFIWGGPGA